MFFVASQVGDKTILMGNQISDFLNQPHNRTLSHRDSLLTKAVTRFMCHGRLFALCYWIQKPSLSPQTTPYFSTHVFCSVLELFFFSQYACLTPGSYQLYWIHETSRLKSLFWLFLWENNNEQVNMYHFNSKWSYI